jgi:hypothetical protein
MVNSEEIRAEFKKYFTIDSELEINPADGKITVHGSCNVKSMHLKTEFLPVHFEEVRGSFNISNLNLQGLQGCPRIVRGDFFAWANQLTSLKGGPLEVHGYYDASQNQLTTLDGCAEAIGGFLVVNNNNLKNLKGCPARLSDDLEVQQNPLVTLDGFPESVAGWVTLTYTPSLPLLRTLSSLHVNILVPESLGGQLVRKKLNTILNQYVGQGRRGMFACKKELVEAGFEGNAKW